MIRINSISKEFKGQKVLVDINLEINDSEILVILGGSGSGKTVLLKHLIGLLQPDSGTIEIDNVDITKLSEQRLLGIRKNMGYLFQEGALYDFFTVFENVAFPLREHTSLSEEKIKEKVKEALKIVDLEGVDDKLPAELSGGMKKRVGLARAVIQNSKVLLCDEPTSGLDPNRSRDISQLIKDVSKKFGCTTIITSHDIPNSFRIADRLALIRDGKIVAVGKPEEIKNNQDAKIREFITQ